MQTLKKRQVVDFQKLVIRSSVHHHIRADANGLWTQHFSVEGARNMRRTAAKIRRAGHTAYDTSRSAPITKEKE